MQIRLKIYGLKSANSFSNHCGFPWEHPFKKPSLFYQGKPKTTNRIHYLSHPQQEETRDHLVPTADGIDKSRHTISKKQLTNNQNKGKRKKDEKRRKQK